MNKFTLTTFETFTKTITIDKLMEDERKITPATFYRESLVRSDLICYPEFLKYFSDLKTLTEHNIIIGINFTYGWMPTIFDFRSYDFNNVINILNRSRNGQIPNESELEILKECFNRSLVGASKLLHFINPNIFPIWDSRVYRYISKHNPYNERLNKYDSYLHYIKFCNETVKERRFKEIHESINNKIASVLKNSAYTVTPIRALELIMYENGGLKSNPENAKGKA